MSKKIKISFKRIMSYIKGVFFNWSPPNNHKFQKKQTLQLDPPPSKSQVPKINRVPNWSPLKITRQEKKIKSPTGAPSESQVKKKQSPQLKPPSNLEVPKKIESPTGAPLKITSSLISFLNSLISFSILLLILNQAVEDSACVLVPKLQRPQVLS